MERLMNGNGHVQRPRREVVATAAARAGGHMELQAVRYAAMVSAMTFDKAVEVYAAHLACPGQDDDARASILEFLGWEEPDEDQLGRRR